MLDVMTEIVKTVFWGKAEDQLRIILQIQKNYPKIEGK
jgi:hypothetical protein